MFNGMTEHLSPREAQAVAAALQQWTAGRNTRRLWQRDASLWTGSDEADWLGWLDVADRQVAALQVLEDFARAVRSFRYALLLGMGGSSLCPEVLASTFGVADGFPRLLVLDSIDPAQIRRFEAQLDLRQTLVVVSSKSGSTLETKLLQEYFWDRMQREVGSIDAGRHFVAITDPGTALAQEAQRCSYFRVFHGERHIGGRFSALSNFGMVPAAMIGIAPERLLTSAREIARACAADQLDEHNPGVRLGVTLGALHNLGRDKPTFIVSHCISRLGDWLEQMLAESTGKAGRGLVPINGEQPGPPEVYGNDRIFIYLRLATAADPDQDRAVARLQDAGQPVVRIEVESPYSLGQEFFRWEFATAVAGALIGVNPFDQPDVEASKRATAQLTAAFAEAGRLPGSRPLLEEAGIRWYAGPRAAAAIKAAAPSCGTQIDYLKVYLSLLGPGDYFCIAAFIDMNEPHERLLQEIRQRIRDRCRIATCVGFGPRFLHSTGQVHKGGPDGGVFLQITADDLADLPVPGRAGSFGVVKAAQAEGDFRVLCERGRRVARLHLDHDLDCGLARLRSRVFQACS